MEREDDCCSCLDCTQKSVVDLQEGGGSQKHDLGKDCHHQIQLLIMAIFCATFQGMILSVLASEMQLLGHPKVFGPGGLTPFDQRHIYKPKMPIC